MTSTLPHPRLTRLPAATADTRQAKLSTDEKALLLEDAAACVSALRKRHEDCAAHVEMTFVAAALALMCGRCRKGNDTPNPSSAAKQCGKETKNPKAVTDWVVHLERLEATLAGEEQAEASRKRAREEEAVAREAAAKLLSPASAYSHRYGTIAFMEQVCLCEFERQHGVNISKDKLSRRRMRDACERAYDALTVDGDQVDKVLDAYALARADPQSPWHGKARAAASAGTSAGVATATRASYQVAIDELYRGTDFEHEFTRDWLQHHCAREDDPAVPLSIRWPKPIRPPAEPAPTVPELEGPRGPNIMFDCGTKVMYGGLAAVVRERHFAVEANFYTIEIDGSAVEHSTYHHRLVALDKSAKGADSVSTYKPRTWRLYHSSLVIQCG